MNNDLIFGSWLLLAALFIGSLLGVIVDRLPSGRNIVLSRSSCDSCSKKLGWLELMPVISWLTQRGQCRSCEAAVSVFYPAIELLALLIVIIVTLAVGMDKPMILGVSVVLGWWLLALGWIDARHFMLPDVMTLPLIPMGLLFTWFLAPDGILSHALAAAVGFTVLWIINLVYRSFRKRDGLGLGDAKLFAAAGAWVGPAGLISVMLVASLSALTYAASLALVGQRIGASDKLAFGAFLCFGLSIVWIFGPVI